MIMAPGGTCSILATANITDCPAGMIGGDDGPLDASGMVGCRENPTISRVESVMNTRKWHVMKVSEKISTIDRLDFRRFCLMDAKLILGVQGKKTA